MEDKLDFEMIRTLYEYEKSNKIPENERLTDWHNDIDIAIPKYKNGNYASMKDIEGRIRELGLCNKEEV